MFKRRAKIGDEEWVFGVQAGKILGIGKSTFYRRFKHNFYPKMTVIRIKGFKYRLRDVYLLNTQT